jgi:hypothetical protein
MHSMGPGLCETLRAESRGDAVYRYHYSSLNHKIDEMGGQQGPSF